MSNIPLTTDTPVQVEAPTEIKSPDRGSEAVIEPPYTDYSVEHNHSYLVDHFQLGDTWDDPEGGFPHEINYIENYVNGKIKSGEIANSISAVKGLIKHMEKFNNLNHEERAVVKLEVLSHYVEFMMKNEQTKSNLRRYNG